MTDAAVPVAAGRTVYAPLSQEARVTPLWAVPLVAVGIGAVLMVAAILGTLAAAMAGASFTTLSSDWRLAGGVAAGLLLALAGLVAIWVKRFERRSLASAGLQHFRPRLETFWFVAGVAFAALCSVAIGAATGGGSDIDGLADALLREPERVLPAAALLALLLAPNSLAEELLFRGWALSAIASRRGAGLAVALTSLAFGAAHVPPTEWAEPARLLSFVSYAAVGAGFAAMALRRRSLYAPIAFHTGFNTLLLTAALAAADMSAPALVEGLTNSPLGTTDLREAGAWLAINLVFAGGLLWRWRQAPAPGEVRETLA